MSKTLLVKYTPRDGSNTAKIADAYMAATTAETTVRDLSQGRVPLLGSAEMATWWSESVGNKLELASEEYIAELKDADHIVIATPMYNWALPAPMKAWFDAVIRGGKTFDGPKGLLKAKSATLITTNGMTETGSDADHLSSNVEQMLKLMGVETVDVISADKLMVIGDEAAAAALEEATQKATEAGRNQGA